MASTLTRSAMQRQQAVAKEATRGPSRRHRSQPSRHPRPSPSRQQVQCARVGTFLGAFRGVLHPSRCVSLIYTSVIVPFSARSGPPFRGLGEGRRNEIQNGGAFMSPIELKTVPNDEV